MQCLHFVLVTEVVRVVRMSSRRLTPRRARWCLTKIYIAFKSFQQVVRQKEFLEKTVVTLKSQLKQVKAFFANSKNIESKSWQSFHFCNVFQILMGAGGIATKGELCEDVVAEQGSPQRNRNTQEGTFAVAEVQS